MRGRELFAWVAVVLSIVLPAMAGESDGVADAAAVAFERLKGLEGEWSAVTPDGDATIVYRVAAAGSIVVERGR